MTGPEDAPQDAEGSNETERRVRDLLADSAVTTPTPSDVAARLDDVLAGLVTGRERPTPDGNGPDGDGADEDGALGAVVGATELGSRRPRLWPRLLVAAAAVSVLGLGIGNLDDITGAGAGDAASTESAAGGAVEDEAAPEASVLSDKAAPRDASQPETLSGGAAPEAQDGGAATGPSEERIQADPYPSLDTAPRLGSGSATLDIQRIEDFALAVPVGAAPAVWDRMCVRPAAGPHDEWLPVRLDGEPGVLLLRAPVGGRRTAEIFTCEDAETPALSTEVRAAR